MSYSSPFSVEFSLIFSNPNSSAFLINSDILKDITVRGRCFIDSGAEMEEAQIFYLEEDEMEELLKDKLKDKYKQQEV